MIEAIIFDAYGTLLDTGTGSVDAARAILDRNGRTDISATIFYGDWKKFHRKHTDSLQEFVTEEEIFCIDLLKLYEKYRIKGNAEEDVQIMLETLGKRKAYPDTRILDSLISKFRLYIGSTSDTAPLVRDIKRNNIKVNGIYTSESLCVYKPKIEFYRAIALDIGIKCEKILFVGDSLIDDVLGPSQVGMKTCFVDRKEMGSYEVAADYTIKTLEGLLEIL